MDFTKYIDESKDPRRLPFEGPILVAHQPEFLPWLSYLSKAAKGDVFVIADTLQYQKRYFQNRNKIRFKNDVGYLWLTVPVKAAGGHTTITSDVRILKGQWVGQHLRSIKYSYSRAPYFAEIYGDLEKIYKYKGDSLSEFLALFINYAFRKFNINIPVYRTSDMIEAGCKLQGHKTDWIISLCKVLNAKTLMAGPSGKTYIEREKFRANDINLVFHSFKHPTYNQIHGDFVPNMAFIDLLFNYGPEAIEVLGKSGFETG